MNPEKNIFPKVPEPGLNGTNLEKTLHYSDLAKKTLKDAAFDKPIEESPRKRDNESEDTVSAYKDTIEQIADLINEYKGEFNHLATLEKEGSLKSADYIKKHILEEQITDKQIALEEAMAKFSPQEFEDTIEKNNTD